MVGKDKHQWSATQGTIVDVRAGRREHQYLIDARNRNGSMVQCSVKHKSPEPYPVGSTVRVEVSILNEIRFDPNVADPLLSSMTMADQIAEAAAAFDRPGAARGPSFGRMGGQNGLAGLNLPGSATYIYSSTSGSTAHLGGMPDQMSGLMSHGIEGLADVIGAITGSATHITGPDGNQYQVDQAEMQRLTQALSSADTHEQLAAKKQLHRIRAAAIAQLAKQGVTGTLGQAAAGAPGPADHVEHRLARLEDLLSKGILTQSEYDTQRQRVIDGI